MRRYSEIDLGLLLLRLGFAALLIGLHGWTRLLRAYNFVVHEHAWPFVGVVHRLGFPFPSVFAVLSALSESVAVAFIAAGLYTRPACLVIGFNMTVAAYNEFRGGDSIELPALYLLVAIVLFLTGPGQISVGAPASSEIDRRP
jgi:putative oxidoreductase